MRFNHFMASHFKSGGCRLIARARDTCRNRDVELYQIPGEWDVVGVSDGTDAWIAPSAASPFFKTATGDVSEILRRMKMGEPLPPVPNAPRARVRIEEDEIKPRPVANGGHRVRI